MRAIPARQSVRKLPQGRVITALDPEFGGQIIQQISKAQVSGAWASANDPFAYEFAINYGCVVTHLGWVNGSAAGGGVDCGIYDLSWNRLVSTGAQTGSGNSLFQWIDVTDTALAPGRYYLAMSRDNTTANRVNSWSSLASADMLKSVGCWDSTTDAYPLPDPLTNMVAAATFTLIPTMAIATRAIFV